MFLCKQARRKRVGGAAEKWRFFLIYWKTCHLNFIKITFMFENKRNEIRILHHINHWYKIEIAY